MGGEGELFPFIISIHGAIFRAAQECRSSSSKFRHPREHLSPFTMIYKLLTFSCPLLPAEKMCSGVMKQMTVTV